MARQGPALRETIQNWSPAQDIVTTSKYQDREGEDPMLINYQREQLPKQDRIYVCVGKGAKGSITEFRYGLEAKLGLMTDFNMPVMNAWALLGDLCTVADYRGSFFLLSLVNRSALLHLSSDATEIDELDNDSTLLDLRYRTVAASLHGECSMQVTEKSAFYGDRSQKYVFHSN